MLDSFFVVGEEYGTYTIRGRTPAAASKRPSLDINGYVMNIRMAFYDKSIMNQGLTLYQLCAVSTVGIAATGFALARREQRTGSQSFCSSKNSTLPRTLTAETGFSKRLDKQSKLQGPSEDRVGAQPVVTDSGSNLVLSQRRRERRRRQTVANPSKAIDDNTTQESAPSNGRPSSSWLRRLSIISSNTGSSLPSPSTTSSVNGPSPHILSRRDSTVKAPNKLIKRSPSQHSIHQPGGGLGRPRSSTLGLRRPATSHQRSSDIARNTSFGQETDLPVPPDFLASLLMKENERVDLHSDSWEPFFASTSNRRRKSTTGNVIVTIKPNRPLNSRYYLDHPTLMLSRSIHNSNAMNMATKHSASNGAEAIPFSDPFLTQNDGTNAKNTTSISKDKRRAVRSSSIPDLASSDRKSRGGSGKGEGKSPMTISRFHAKDRVVSNPLPRDPSNIGPGKSGSPRLRRKRNFTESDTFGRPQTAPNADYSRNKPRYIDEPFPQDLAFPTDMLRSTDGSASHRNGSYDYKSSPVGFPSAGTSPPTTRYSRNKRLSGATSDLASTVIGSDDTRVFTSADEDDQSDSVFDSFRTRMSSSSNPGRRGPNIETIFRDGSPLDSKAGGSVAVNELDLEKLRLSHSTPRSSISDIESMTTPLAPSAAKDTDVTPTPPTRYPFKTALHSSPLKPLASHVLEVVAGSDDEAVLEYGDDELDVSFEDHLVIRQSHHDPFAGNPSLKSKSSGLGTKASVFDWSEQTWSERDPQAHEVRPSTVHGKQGINPRGTRTASRKAPSALHLRSQSVPVSRDGPPPSESRQPSAKFGTWGLGQKGVSEDWDGDFDFGDSDEDLNVGGGNTSGERLHIMKVPQAIMETQASVHGQYGQVQELTLLVEELKRLRIQGNKLHIIQGPSSELWKEAEGIVNLATFEDEENNWQAPGSPSSCGSFDDFEISPSPPQKAWRHNDIDMKRPPLTLWSDMDHNSPPSGTKETAAKAKSVLETIYQQRESSEAPTLESAGQTPQKLPFDTQSLKELVTRAGGVTRALKDVIRRAEGVAPIRESTIPSDPPFSQIFAQRS